MAVQESAMVVVGQAQLLLKGYKPLILLKGT